jgi:predicted nucleotidyltransferase
MDLKEIRHAKNLTQKQAADLLKIPLKTYQNYELGRSKLTSLSGRAIVLMLSSYEPYTPEKGILPFDYLKKTVAAVLHEYPIDYAYLFGSYAKGKTTEKSDVDILLSTQVDGLAFFGLVGKLENALHKKVDVIRFKDLTKDQDFLDEIMKTGIRIYG